MKVLCVLPLTIAAASVLAQTNLISGTVAQSTPENGTDARITTPTMNVSEGDLAASLEKTQTQLRQTLALLRAYNQKAPGAGAASTAASPNTAIASAAAVQETPPLLRSSGANLSANYGANYSVRSGQNLSVNLSTSPAGVPPAAQPMTAYADKSIAGTTPPNGTGTANPPPGGGLAQDTLNSLALLQTELERALPVLAAANYQAGRSVAESSPAMNVTTNQAGFPTPTGRSTGRPAPPGPVRIIGQ